MIILMMSEQVDATISANKKRGRSKVGTDEEVTDRHVFQYLKEGCYPDQAQKTMKRRIRSKAANYSISDGKLFYTVMKSKGQKLDSLKSRCSSQRVVLLTDEEKQDVLKTLHCGTEGGHLGQMKTMFKIEHRYYWSNMTKDIRQFVSRCHTCQTVNKKFCNSGRELYPIPIERPEFFHFVAIDCITHLPESFAGNTNIIVATCKFTKFAFAKATADIKAPTVATYLYNLFCMFGWPSILLSDQGRESCNQIVDTLTSIVDRRHTSSYHPQANGQVSSLRVTRTYICTCILY